MAQLKLTSLVGILSIPGAFLEFRNFKMVLISLSVTLESQLEDDILMELDCKWISSILVWFLHLSRIELKTPFFFVWSSIKFYFFRVKTTRPINNVNVMTLFLRQPLFVRNGFIAFQKKNIGYYPVTCNIRKMIFDWFFSNRGTLVSLLLVQFSVNFVGVF